MKCLQITRLNERLRRSVIYGVNCGRRCYCKVVGLCYNNCYASLGCVLVVVASVNLIEDGIRSCRCSLRNNCRELIIALNLIYPRSANVSTGGNKLLCRTRIFKSDNSVGSVYLTGSCFIDSYDRFFGVYRYRITVKVGKRNRTEVHTAIFNVFKNKRFIGLVIELYILIARSTSHSHNGEVNSLVPLIRNVNVFGYAALYRCGKDYLFSVVGLRFFGSSGNLNLRRCDCGNVVFGLKNYVLIRHRFVRDSVVTCPALYFLTVILGDTREKCKVSACGKESGFKNLAAKHIGYLVDLLKLNLGINSGTHC